MSGKILIVSRLELKYGISHFQYVSLSERLGNILIQDKNNGAVGYTIRSLYFDSYSEKDFYDKLDGIENRKKIRLRIYSCDDKTAKRI